MIRESWRKRTDCSAAVVLALGELSEIIITIIIIIIIIFVIIIIIRYTRKQCSGVLVLYCIIRPTLAAAVVAEYDLRSTSNDYTHSLDII